MARWTAGWRGGVYPRVCGGTDGAGWAALPVPGLSPRVRGNHLGYPSCLIYYRSIPACAGEPPRPRRLPLVTRVYPRVCGGTSPA